MTDLSQNQQSEPKDDKKIQHLVRGSLLLVFAAWMTAASFRIAFYRLKTGTFVAWIAGDTVLRLAVAIFCVWFGARALRRGAGAVPPTKVGWGRVVFGISLIYADIRGHYFPTPGAVRPDDAIGRLITALFYMAGAALVVSAFAKLRQKPPAVCRREETQR